jgi:uroporphyrinogen decarboxylase
MNGKDRILAALNRKIPDRVPLYIHGINEAPIVGIGRHLGADVPDAKEFHAMDNLEKMKLVDTLFLLHEAFGVDGFTSFEIGHDQEMDAKHVRDDWGIVYTRSPHGIPVASGHPIPDAKALTAYRLPEPDRTHLLLLDLARDRFGDRKALFWLMRGTFVRSWRLVGMENYMLKLYSEPAFLHRIAEMTLAYNLAQLDMLADAGLDVLVVEDDIASTQALLISPAHFEEFVHPYNRQIVQRAHESGLKVVRHSDGNLWQIMDTLLDTGYDGLNPLEPQAGMDLKRVKTYCGGRICLLGNIDCQELLPHGTVAQVEAAVQKAIDDAGQGGGLIICSSNSLHPAVNPANCIAMFEATKKYGRYDTSQVI